MKNNKKWVFILLFSLLIYSGCLGRETKQPPETVILSLCDTMPPDHPSAAAITHFAGMVKEKTEGRVDIKVYYEGSKGTPRELIEQVRFGGLAMARVNALELTDEVLQLQSYFRPLERDDFGAAEMMAAVSLHSEQLRDACQMERMTPLVWFYPDFRCFYSLSYPLTGKEGLSGKKIKSNDTKLITEALEKIGADAVGLINTDANKALIAGNIDGVESSFGEFICQNRSSYIRFITRNDAWHFPDVLLINSASLTSLPKADREIVEACAAESYAYQQQLQELFWQEQIEKLIEDQQILFSEGEY